MYIVSFELLFGVVFVNLYCYLIHVVSSIVYKFRKKWRVLWE